MQSLDFDDHPFRAIRASHACGLCGATDSYLDEVVIDNRGGRLFVCSDTDHCAARRAEGHRGAEAADQTSSPPLVDLSRKADPGWGEGSDVRDPTAHALAPSPSRKGRGSLS